jgi:hypothetical protein
VNQRWKRAVNVEEYSTEQHEVVTYGYTLIDAYSGTLFEEKTTNFVFKAKRKMRGVLKNARGALELTFPGNPG